MIWFSDAYLLLEELVFFHSISISSIIRTYFRFHVQLCLTPIIECDIDVDWSRHINLKYHVSIITLFVLLSPTLRFVFVIGLFPPNMMSLMHSLQCVLSYELRQIRWPIKTRKVINTLNAASFLYWCISTNNSWLSFWKYPS